MATVAVPAYETVDGESVETAVEVEVSEAVLKILRQGQKGERRLRTREITFTDLTARQRRTQGKDSPDFNPSDESGLPAKPEPDESRRSRGRDLSGSPGARRKGFGHIIRRVVSIGWGARFTVYLGEGRPGWTSRPYRDEQGRCGTCHDRALPPGWYCIDCDRAGKELDILGPPMSDVKREFANSVMGWHDSIRVKGYAATAGAAKAEKAARKSAGVPEPPRPPRPLKGGLGTKPRGRTAKQKKAAKKGTGVNHFDLKALRLRNAEAK